MPARVQADGDSSGLLEHDAALLAQDLVMKNKWPETKIRVGLIEPYDIYRLGLQDIIEQEADMFVVYALETFPSNCVTLPPVDIALVNDRLTVRVSARPPEHCPHPLAMRWRIIPVPERVLPAHDSATADKALRLCGASSGRVLATFIRHVAEKSQHAIPATFSSHLSHLEVIDAWSQEDHEIVRHLAQGCTNRNIAQHVYLSESSVKKKLHRLMASLGCQSRSQLAACYAQYEAHKGPL